MLKTSGLLMALSAAAFAAPVKSGRLPLNGVDYYYEVHGTRGDPLLVPMVKDAIRRVEPERRRIEVDREFLGLPAASEAPGGGREPRR